MLVQFFLRSTVLANSVCETPCLNISLWNLQKESPCFLDRGNLMGTSKSVNSYLHDFSVITTLFLVEKYIHSSDFFFSFSLFLFFIWLFYLIIFFVSTFLNYFLRNASSFNSCIQGSLLIQLQSFKVHNIVLTRNYVQE